jgi:hypothetical protein
MSRTRYQLLPVTDPSPALAVNLSVADGATSAASNSPQEQQATMTEINLNNSETPTNNSNTNNSTTTNPVNNGETNANASNISATSSGDISSEPLPPLNELPSYNEAIRLKKLEAYTNDLPPSYFDPAGSDPREFRSTMEPVNVS